MAEGAVEWGGGGRFSAGFRHTLVWRRLEEWGERERIKQNTRKASGNG